MAILKDNINLFIVCPSVEYFLHFSLYYQNAGRMRNSDCLEWILSVMDNKESAAFFFSSKVWVSELSFLLQITA